MENPLLRRAERVAKIALRRNSRLWKHKQLHLLQSSETGWKINSLTLNRTTKEKRAVLAVWKGGSAQKLEDEMVSRVREQVIPITTTWIKAVFTVSLRRLDRELPHRWLMKKSLSSLIFNKLLTLGCRET